MDGKNEQTVTGAALTGTGGADSGTTQDGAGGVRTDGTSTGTAETPAGQERTAGNGTASGDGSGKNESQGEAGKAGQAGQAGQAQTQKSQTDGKSAENARRRREQQAREDIRRAREEERVSSIIEALDGKNPYNGEAMKDAADVEVFLTMKRIKASGGDPVTDYARARADADRESARRAADDQRAREDQRRWYEEDRAAFERAHPEISLSDLLSDGDFAEYAEGKVGKKPLSDIYEGYTRMQQRYSRAAEEKAAQALANARASAGSIAGSGSSAEPDFFTEEQVRKMSQAEVHKNYAKIMKSMEKWKN